MARPDKGRRRTWRFKLDESTILEVHAPRGATDRQVRRRGRAFVAFATAVTALVVVAVAAADQVQGDSNVVTAGIQSNPIAVTLAPSGSTSVATGVQIRSQGSTHVTFPVSVAVTTSNTTGSTLGIPTVTPVSVTAYADAGEATTSVPITAPGPSELDCGEDNLFSGKVTFTAAAQTGLTGGNVTDFVTVNVTVTGPPCAPANAAPTVGAPSVAPEPSNEGDAVTASTTFTDDGFGGGPVSCTVDYDDGSGALAGTVSGTATSGTCTGPAHTYVDDDDDVCSGGVCNVSVTVSDGSLSGSNSSTHVVNNVAPTVGSLVAGGAASCGSANSLTINFTDPAGSNDTYSAAIDWGDGTSSSPTSISSGDAASHTYALAGSYTATVTVSDEDGGTSTAATMSLVVNYNLSPLLQPINNTGHGQNPSVFKYGSAVPVKVEITDCDGSHPRTLDVRVFAVKTSSIPPSDGESEAAVANQADAGNQMRYSDPIHIFNWSTKSISDATSTVLVTVKIVATGQTVSAVIGLRAK